MSPVSFSWGSCIFSLLYFSAFWRGVLPSSLVVSFVSESISCCGSILIVAFRGSLRIRRRRFHVSPRVKLMGLRGQVRGSQFFRSVAFSLSLSVLTKGLGWHIFVAKWTFDYYFMRRYAFFFAFRRYVFLIPVSVPCAYWQLFS